MELSYGRLIGARHNRLVQSSANLMGIAAGLIADRKLNDEEIRFLQGWLEANAEVRDSWPGDVLYERVGNVLADGKITEDERAHLLETLKLICGGSLERAISVPVNELAFDEVTAIQFPGSSFCVTGDFVYGPRDRVQEVIVANGGAISKSVTKRLNYLVVGLRGSDEWKHGSFGTKIEKAIQYKRAGQELWIVREDKWSAALRTGGGAS